MPALVAFVVAWAAAATPPAPARWVEDHAALISPSARAALDTRLEAYQRATGHQVVVWIGTTIDGADLADWAVRTFAAWKLGRAGHDDGVAIFVLARDRAIDIEVGYGLEDRVPDAIASRIIHEVMAPKLRAGDADLAITGGAEAILAAIEGRPWAGGREQPAPWSPSPFELVLSAVALVVFAIVVVRHPRVAIYLLWAIASGMGRGRRGGGRGGMTGGGGRSGGGGARGHWQRSS